MNKKGQMMGVRKVISFVLGLVFLALGLLPLLGVNLPPIPALVLWLLALAGGIYLLIDAYKERMGMGLSKFIMWLSVIVGLLILTLGLIPILNSMGVLAFALPVLGAAVVNILYTVAGVLLIIGSFIGF